MFLIIFSNNFVSFRLTVEPWNTGNVVMAVQQKAPCTHTQIFAHSFTCGAIYIKQSNYWHVIGRWRKPENLKETFLRQ